MISKIESLVAIGLPILLYLMVFTDNIIFFYLSVMIGLLFLTKPVVLLPWYFVSSLSTSYFSLSNGMSAGRFTFVVILVSLFIQVINNQRKFTSPYILIVTILLIYSFLSAITSVTGSIEPFVLMTMNILFFLLLQYDDSIDMNKFYRYLSIAFFICLISIAFFILQHGQDLLLKRFHDEEEAMNSNRIAMMCNQTGTFLFAVFLLSKGFITKVLSILGFIAAILEIIILGTRSALIALILTSIIGIYLYQKANNNVSKKTIRLIFVSLIFIGGFIIYYLSMIDSPLMERFSVEAIVESKGTNRLNLIEIIMTKIFPDYPLFGVGIGSENIYEAGKPFGLERPGHNIIIDPLSQLGIVGFSLFLFLIIPLFVKSLKATLDSKIKYLITPAFLLFLTSVINGVGEIVFYERFFWNDMALCAYCLVLYRRSKVWGCIKHWH